MLQGVLQSQGLELIRPDPIIVGEDAGRVAHERGPQPLSAQLRSKGEAGGAGADDQDVGRDAGVGRGEEAGQGVLLIVPFPGLGGQWGKALPMLPSTHAAPTVSRWASAVMALPRLTMEALPGPGSPQAPLPSFPP